MAMPDIVKLFYSDRGLPLVFWASSDVERVCPIVTIENYCKWYNLYVVMPDDTVRQLRPEEYGVNDLWLDHVPNPRHLDAIADRLGMYLDPNSFEMIIGRYRLEIKDDYHD
jgi:hypothetical protein